MCMMELRGKENHSLSCIFQGDIGEPEDTKNAESYIMYSNLLTVKINIYHKVIKMSFPNHLIMEILPRR